MFGIYCIIYIYKKKLWTQNGHLKQSNKYDQIIKVNNINMN